MRKLKPSQRRTVMVLVRLRADEARAIRAAAGEVKGLATWMREEALKAAALLEVARKGKK